MYHTCLPEASTSIHHGLSKPLLLFSRSVMSDSLRPHGLQDTRLPCPTPTPSLLKLTSIKSVMPSNHLILCCPLLLLPSIFPNIRVFSSESALHITWPKYWSFSFSISPSNEYSGLISFRKYLQGISPCSPRDSQGSSPAPQFERISSSALNLLSGPTLTSILDYWKNHSFDYMASNASVF